MKTIYNRVLARFLRAFFDLLYHPLAWMYDFVAASVSLGQWKTWVMTTLPYLEGPRVLELGYGPGHLQVALTERGVATFGLDTSPQMARLARNKLQRKSFPYKLSIGNAQHPPFPDNTFDQVVATFPPEFINSFETLYQIYRVLKPGGQLIVLPNAWITGKKLWQRTAAGLFEVTQQAPTWNDRFMEPFSKAGFKTQAIQIRGKFWVLMIIQATKR